MEVTSVVDTYFELNCPQKTDLQKYINQLRSDLIPGIDKLKNDDLITWFCFLVHSSAELHGREENNSNFVHIKLCPKNITANELINYLPQNFKNPIIVNLSDIGGINTNFIKNKDISLAWELIGSASEFAISFIKMHDSDIPLKHFVQYGHFFMNPIGLGNQSLFIQNAHPF